MNQQTVRAERKGWLFVSVWIKEGVIEKYLLIDSEIENWLEKKGQPRWREQQKEGMGCCV